MADHIREYEGGGADRDMTVDVVPAVRLPGVSKSQWGLQRVGLALLAAGLLACIWLVPSLYAAPAVVALIVLALCLRYPLVGFCLLAFSVPWGGGFPVSLGAFPLTSTDILVAVVTIAWLVAALHGDASWLPRTVWTPYILLYLVAIALSVTQATDRNASAAEILKWIEMAVVYWSATSFLRTRRDIEAVVACVVVAGVTQALLGYVQFGFHFGPQAFGRGIFLRAFGTFDQPNPYAGYLNVTLPFALALGLRHSLSPARFWYRVAAALVAGGILVSGSRGAYLAGILATVVVLSLAVPWFRVWAWLGVLAGVVGSWLAAYNLVPLGPFQRLLAAVGVGNVSFTSVNNDNFSAVERAAHWLAGVRMFASHPVLGVGIGNYAAAYPNYHPRGWYAPLGHAHNYYINIAAEAGIIGLSAYLLLAGSALWYSYAALRHVPDGVLYAAILGVLGALIATYFHNLFDVLYVHGMAALFGVLVALVPASITIRQREGLVPLTGKSHRVETLWNRPRGG